MTGKLLINIDDLLKQRTIEGERIEYKAGWNPMSVLRPELSEQVAQQVTQQVTQQDTGQVTEQVPHHVRQLVVALTGELSRAELQAALSLAHRPHFIVAYLRPALEAGLVEMTLPDKPTSRNQRYRRTAAGHALAQQTTDKDTAT